MRVRLGTRRSPLALAQATEVKRRMLEQNSNLQIELVHMNTTGDTILDRRLEDIGGKGLFTKELDNALEEKAIDVAVHSMKDMETILPQGQEIIAVLPRADARDVFISASGKKLEELPLGSVVGTASLRRQAQLLFLRPDLKIKTLRGNVQTRLRKLEAGEVDATLLAYAGLARLDMTYVITQILSTEHFLPAAAQGAIAVTSYHPSQELKTLFSVVHDKDTFDRVTAERALLASLDGSCRTPIAALAVLDGTMMELHGVLALRDGTHLVRKKASAPRGQAINLGKELGRQLKEMLPQALI